MSDRPTVACVLHKSPVPSTTGSRRRTAALLDGIATIAELHLVATRPLGPGEADAIARRWPRASLDELACGRRRRPVRALRWVWSADPWDATDRRWRSLAATLTGRWERGDLDAVFLPGVDHADLVPQGPPVLLDLQHVDGWLASEASARGPAVRAAHGWDARRRTAREERAVARAALTTVTTAEDLARLGAGTATVLPSGADPARARPVRPALSSGVSVGHLGPLGHPPNLESARALVENVLPELRRRGVEVRARIGTGGSDRAALAHDPDVRVDGWIDDLDDWFATIDVLVSLPRSGTGGRIKVLDALARGVPVVTTERGAEGVTEDLRPFLHVVASTAAAADALAEIAADPATALERTAAAATLVARERSWDAISQRYAGLVRQVVRS